jgi:ABC-type branched-subunit amino acid transport system substrate-binding protein
MVRRELAAATINAAGGIKGRPIKLIVEDAEYRLASRPRRGD